MTSAEPYVLFVVDREDWALGTLAREYTDMLPRGLSGRLLPERDIVARPFESWRVATAAQLVHFLTPQHAWTFRWLAAAKHAAVTVTHLEDVSIQALRLLHRSTSLTLAAMSHASADDLEERLNLTAVSLRPGVPQAFLQDSSTRIEAREAALAGGGPLRIGFAGKASSDSDGRKGLRELHETLANVARQRSVEVWLMGEGWETLSEVLRAQELAVIQVHAPDMDSRFRFYSSIDIYLCTSRLEGGPLPLAEAMASGVVPVSTRVGFAPEFVVPGHNGILADVGDVDALSRGILVLIDDSGARQRMRYAAAEYIASHGRWASHHDTLNALYEDALHRSPWPRLYAASFALTIYAHTRTCLRAREAIRGAQHLLNRPR